MPSLIKTNSPDQIELLASITEVMKDADFPDLKSIICEFMRISGGAEGVAKMLKREYNRAKAGSMVRSMILQMILQGAKAVAAKDDRSGTDMMSDEDIEDAIKSKVAKAVSAANGRTPGPSAGSVAQGLGETAGSS